MRPVALRRYQLPVHLYLVTIKLESSSFALLCKLMGYKCVGPVHLGMKDIKRYQERLSEPPRYPFT